MNIRTLPLAAVLIIGLTACNSANSGVQQMETAQFEEKQGNKEHAVKLYEEIIAKYPDSPNAKTAQERLTILKGGR